MAETLEIQLMLNEDEGTYHALRPNHHKPVLGDKVICRAWAYLLDYEAAFLVFKVSAEEFEGSSCLEKAGENVECEELDCETCRDGGACLADASYLHTPSEPGPLLVEETHHELDKVFALLGSSRIHFTVTQHAEWQDVA